MSDQLQLQPTRVTTCTARSASKGTHDAGNTVDWSRIDEGEQA